MSAEKTYTVQLSSWELLQLIKCHTREIARIKNATGKAVTSERLNLMPRTRAINAILEQAKEAIHHHAARGNELIALVKQ